MFFVVVVVVAVFCLYWFCLFVFLLDVVLKTRERFVRFSFAGAPFFSLSHLFLKGVVLLLLGPRCVGDCFKGLIFFPF